jgi:hypothetical protein
MENPMKIIELIIDENRLAFGVNCISIVADPAMEASFIALSKEYEIKFSLDDEKHIITGPVMIPNKLILRRIDNQLVQVYFSVETIRKTAELYLMNYFQNNSSLEHKIELDGVSTVESWIKDDEQYDKSNMYHMNYPVGTWFVSQKVNNDDVWNNEIKTGKVTGFSIEGFFTDKITMSTVNDDEQKVKRIIDLLSN